MGWRASRAAKITAGLGLGHVEAGVVTEELGRTLTPSPFLSTAILAANALARRVMKSKRASTCRESSPAI